MRSTKSQALKSRLEALEATPRAELNALFEAEFGHTPAPRSSLEWMRQNLAWAAQARAQGDVPQKRRDQLARALSRQQRGKAAKALPYRPGTRLVREWQGQVYEVTVLEEGFAWEGRVYPNLSRIATDITGTKWSGPRFFGLKRQQHGQQ